MALALAHSPLEWICRCAGAGVFSVVPLGALAGEKSEQGARNCPGEERANVIPWLMPQIDVFLSLVSWSPLVTAAAL